MEHTICVKTKDMKRTYNAINAHRTENVEEHTHTFNRTQKKEQLGQEEVEEKKKSSGRVPPSVITIRGGARRGEAGRGEAGRGALRCGAVRCVRRQTKDQRANPHRGLAFYSNPVTQSPRICHVTQQFVAAFWAASWPISGSLSGRLPSTSSRVTLSHTRGKTTYQ